MKSSENHETVTLLRVADPRSGESVCLRVLPWLECIRHLTLALSPIEAEREKNKMPDVFTQAKRSDVMSRIRSRAGTRDTEMALLRVC